LKNEEVHARLFDLGHAFMKGLRDAARETGHDFLVQGLGPMFHIGFTPLKEVSDYRSCLSYDKTKLARFVALMAENGVRLIGRGLVYISAAHTPEDIKTGIETARRVLAQMKDEQDAARNAGDLNGHHTADGHHAPSERSDETADVLTPDAASPSSREEVVV
jgi:glutamate-1-semialdehyde 2,1-aminomutase